MKKVTCIGYHDTGSSVITDYLKEYKGVVYPKIEVECRYLEDPDGISDLEYNLIDNWNRLNQGFAIKRFEQFAMRYNHHYSLLFGDNWKYLTNKLVQELVDYTYPGYWHCDISIFPIYKQYLYYLKRGFNRLLPQRYRKTPDYNYFPKATSYYSHPDRDTFYQIIKSFNERLFASISDADDNIMMLDQCIPTTNIKRYLNYFDNIKVILVDRDPRDVYIEEQHIDDHVLPSDPYIFMQIYKDMRKTREEELKNDSVLFIQFEDMIYRYNETTKKVIDFLELSDRDHVSPLQCFNPEKSKNNTKLWIRYPEHDKVLKMFDSELENYYYFDKV